MATFGTPERDAVASTPAPTGHGNPLTVPAAITLWAVVGGLLGSTSQHLIVHAGSPVAVVRLDDGR